MWKLKTCKHGEAFTVSKQWMMGNGTENQDLSVQCINVVGLIRLLSAIFVFDFPTCVNNKIFIKVGSDICNFGPFYAKTAGLYSKPITCRRIPYASQWPRAQHVEKSALILPDLVWSSSFSVNLSYANAYYWCGKLSMRSKQSRFSLYLQT